MRTTLGGLALAPFLIACGSVADAPADAGPADGRLVDDAGEVASLIDGLRWELACRTSTSPELCTTAEQPVSKSALLLGSPGECYELTLRFRGVVEPKTYTGGTRDGAWHVGGTPAADSANIYQLEISDPPQTYFVNAGTTRPSNMLFCETIDFTRRVTANAGATVTLLANPLDALQISNHDATGAPLIVADVPPAPASFNGQFVHMDVVSVTARP